MSTLGATQWASTPCKGGDPRAIPPELNAAYELRARQERRDRVARVAARYLDANCDWLGHRYEGGMSVREYAVEVGVCPEVLSKHVTLERRRRCRTRHNSQ